MHTLIRKWTTLMDLDALSTFNLIATHGGIGAASRASGIPKTTLARRLRGLEDSLGVRLIERGATALHLTEGGRALHIRSEGLIAELRDIGRDIADGDDRLRGRLRVSAPVLLAHTSLSRVVGGFSTAHPEVRVEMIAEDRLVDPVSDGYDVVVRVNPAPNSNLVGRHFFSDDYVVIAPAGWSGAREAGILRGDTFPAIGRANGSDPTEWVARAPSGDEIRLRPNITVRLSSWLMVRDAVLAGGHAALLPRSIVAGEIASGRLLCWGSASGEIAEVWALHPSRRLASAKVKAFVQALCDAYSPVQRLRA
jgi:DNA-binding transcriptional LysR family regulator